MTELDALRTIGFLLESRSRRVRYRQAVSDTGFYCKASYPRARCWCLLGALDLLVSRFPRLSIESLARSILQIGRLRSTGELVGHPCAVLSHWWDRALVREQDRLLEAMRALP